jgi:hypothetical protein
VAIVAVVIIATVVVINHNPVIEFPHQPHTLILVIILIVMAVVENRHNRVVIEHMVVTVMR